MAKRSKTQIPAWMADYYRNSAGGSVLSDYAEGRAVTVNADRKRQEIDEAEAALRAADDEINAAYWRFSRSTSASLHGLDNSEMYARRNVARERLLNLRRG